MYILSLRFDCALIALEVRALARRLLLGRVVLHARVDEWHASTPRRPAGQGCCNRT